MMDFLDMQETSRRLYRTRWFARFYSRLAGQASVAIFADCLEDRLLRHLPTGAQVLEVGCGPGLQAIDISRRRPDINLIASDFSSEFVRLGQVNLATVLKRSGAGSPTHLSPSFVQADAMDLTVFRNGSFDAVYSLTAIKHFPDPVRGINECMRVLKPGGRFVLSEFDRDSTRAEMTNLTGLMRVPAWLKRALARVIQAGVKHEAPSRQDVRQWLSAANIAEDDYQLTGIGTYPVWIATVGKAK